MRTATRDTTPHRSRTVLAALALVLAALAAGCGDSIRHESRRTPAAPRRIVSLAPSVTEVLFALGLGDRVVGVTTEDDYPPEAAAKEKIGDASTNVEKVLALRPDLVIGHSFLNGRALAALKQLGVPVLGVEAKDLKSVAESIRAVGAACGAKERGEEIAAKMNETVADVGARCATAADRPVVLFAAQASPLWAAGSQTFVNEMIRCAGGTNGASGAGQEFSVMSEEAAVSMNPDFIFVTDENARRYFAEAKAWAAVKAVRNGRVVLVDPDLYLRPGPRLVDGLRELAAALHPELEKAHGSQD